MATHSKTGHAHSPVVAGGAVQWTNAFAYLVITDGTTTITLQDGLGGNTNYPLRRQVWTPVVAGLRQSQLGGRTPYEDVVEALAIQVRGTSAQDAFSKLAALARLLEQAERWGRGENVDAVVVKFCPKGALLSSVINPLQATILGRAPGDETAGVGLTGEWNAAGTHFVIPEVRVRFLRRGQWLLKEQVATTSRGLANGELVTLAMPTAVDDPSPTRVELTNFGYGKDGSTKFHGGYLLLSDAPANHIAVLNAESAAAGVYTSVTDAGQNPRSTNILRYTPGGVTVVRSGQVNLGGITYLNQARLVAVWANVRPSATVSFRLRASLWSGLADQCTPYCPIPTAATLFPTWRFLGLAPISSGGVSLLYLDTIASDASSFLDIDTIVLADARQTRVLSILAADDDVTSIAVADSATLTVDHQLLDEPQPAVRGGFTAYAGDAVFATKAATLYGLLLATGGGSGAAGNDWRQAKISDDSVLQNTWTVSRRPAHLVPS